MQDYLILGFINGKVFYDQANSIPMLSTNISALFSNFKKNTFWKIKILNFSKDEHKIYAEILNYNSSYKEFDSQSLYPYPVSIIIFNHIDTDHLLRCTISQPKNKEPNLRQLISKIDKPSVFHVEKIIFKKEIVKLDIKVPIVNLSYHDGYVTFQTTIDEKYPQITIRVDNYIIRKEFGSISNYLSKALSKQYALFEVLFEKEVDQRGTLHSVRVEKATSKDIERIDSSIIEDVKCEFLVEAILDGKVKIKDSHKPKTPEEFIDDLLGRANGENSPSTEVIMERAFQFKNPKHHLHLKYLASKHKEKVFKLRFSILPFAFLFLVEGNQKFFFVLETFHEELATYIWECEKSKEAMKGRFAEIEQLMVAFEETNRQKYLETEAKGFRRIYHKYTNEVDGFNRWRDDFEKVLAS